MSATTGVAIIAIPVNTKVVFTVDVGASGKIAHGGNGAIDDDRIGILTNRRGSQRGPALITARISSVKRRSAGWQRAAVCQLHSVQRSLHEPAEPPAETCCLFAAFTQQRFYRFSIGRLNCSTSPRWFWHLAYRPESFPLRRRCKRGVAAR